jgi:hypothetical protein
MMNILNLRVLRTTLYDNSRSLGKFVAGRLPLPRAPGRIMKRSYSGFSDGFHFALLERLDFLRLAPDQLGG